MACVMVVGVRCKDGERDECLGSRRTTCVPCLPHETERRRVRVKAYVYCFVCNMNDIVLPICDSTGHRTEGRGVPREGARTGTRPLAAHTGRAPDPRTQKRHPPQTPRTKRVQEEQPLR